MYPVVIVIAPAGFGKTTAIRQLLSTCAAPISISVRPGTTNLQQFMRAFAIGCADRFPAMKEPPDSFNAISPVAKNVDLYATWAIAHLKDVDCVIAIDDLQNIAPEIGAADFLLRLSEGCRPRLQLILSSRTSDNLPYVHWQAYGDATAAITADDLRMTLDEAVDLAHTVRSVATAEQLASWVRETNGFPIPLSFAIRASTTQDDALNIMKGARSLTFRFLVEHLWESLSKDERYLLELASILPPTRLRDYAHSGIAKAADKLSAISEHIAFVTLNGDNFIVHDLLRDFIKQELLKQDPSVLENLYERASTLLFASKRISQAFDILIESGNVDLVYDNVEKHPPPMSNLDLVTRLIDLSAGYALADLQLEMLVLHTELSTRNGDTGRGLRAAEEILKRKTATSVHRLCALRAMSRCTEFQTPLQRQHWRNRMTPVLLELEDQHQIQAKAHYALYLARLSEPTEVILGLAEEIQLDLHRLELKERFVVQNTLAVMMFFLGDSRAAVQISREAYEVAKAIGDNIGIVQVLNTLGLMLYDRCDPEVEDISKLLLPLVEKTGAWRFSTVSHMLPSEYYARQGSSAKSSSAAALQKDTIIFDAAEIEQSLYYRKMCANLRNLIDKKYATVILDYEDAVLPESVGAAYHVLVILSIAYAFSGSAIDAARTLQKARSERERLRSAWEQRFVVDVIVLEIIALALVGKWNQAKLLIKDDQLASNPARSLTGALRLFTDGAPFTGVLSALEECFDKPYVGLGAMLVRRAIDQLAEAREAPMLSPSERVVLELIGRGRSNKEIANERGRSAETIKRQVASLFKKLGVENRTSAVAVAREHGLL